MPLFLVSYTDGAGGRRHEHVEGSSVGWVEEHLRLRGCAEVRVHTQEILSTEGRDLRGEIEPQNREAMIAGARGAILGWAKAVAFLLVLDVGLWFAGGWLFWAAVVVTSLVALFAAFVTVPMALFEEAQRAKIEHEWPLVLRLTGVLSWHPLWWSIPALRAGVAMERARALAGLGRLDEALSHMAAARRHMTLSGGMFQSTLGSLCMTARQVNQGFSYYQAAVAQDEACCLDGAIAVLHYGADVEQARVWLALRAEVSLTEVELAFLAWGQGLLALEDGYAEQGLARLDEAKRRFTVVLEPQPHMLRGISQLLDAYRSLCLARLGRLDEARSIVHRVGAHLRRTGEERLLARCEAAIG